MNPPPQKKKSKGSVHLYTIIVIYLDIVEHINVGIILLQKYNFVGL